MREGKGRVYGIGKGQRKQEGKKEGTWKREQGRGNRKLGRRNRK